MRFGRVFSNGAFAAVFSAALTAPAAAQGTWQDLPALPAGTVVDVALTNGAERHGRLESIAGDDLLLDESGTIVRLPRATIAQISREGDSLRNGAIIGALAGAGAAVIWGGFIYGLCANENGVNCPSLKAASVTIPFAIGIPLGILIDAMHEGTTTVYRAPGRIAVAPMVSPGRYGAYVSVDVGRR